MHIVTYILYSTYCKPNKRCWLARGDLQRYSFHGLDVQYPWLGGHHILWPGMTDWVVGSIGSSLDITIHSSILTIEPFALLATGDVALRRTFIMSFQIIQCVKIEHVDDKLLRKFYFMYSMSKSNVIHSARHSSGFWSYKIDIDSDF
jgi:hypothetical protein